MMPTTRPQKAEPIDSSVNPEAVTMKDMNAASRCGHPASRGPGDDDRRAKA